MDLWDDLGAPVAGAGDASWDDLGAPMAAPRQATAPTGQLAVAAGRRAASPVTANPFGGTGPGTGTLDPDKLPQGVPDGSYGDVGAPIAPVGNVSNSIEHSFSASGEPGRVSGDARALTTSNPGNGGAYQAGLAVRPALGQEAPYVPTGGTVVPGQGRFGAMAANLARGAVTGTADVAAGAVRGAGYLASAMGSAEQGMTEGQAPPPVGELPTDRTAGRIARFGADTADSALPVDSRYADSTWVKASGMVGGALPYLAAAAVSGPAGPISAAAAGAAGTYESIFQDATAHGATPDKAHEAALLPALIGGGLMSVNAGVILKGLPWGAQQGLTRAIVDTAAASGTMVGVSEMQKLANNFNARQTYDPHRSLMEGVGDDVAAEALSGGLLHAGVHARGAVSGTLDRLTQPVAAPELRAGAAGMTEAAAGANERTADTAAAAPDQLPGNGNDPGGVRPVPPPVDPNTGGQAIPAGNDNAGPSGSPNDANRSGGQFTDEQRASLAGLGYSAADIAAMPPDAVGRVIERGQALPQPAAAQPDAVQSVPAWQAAPARDVLPDSSVPLTGSTFASKAGPVVSRLMGDFYLTREQAAGIVGNLGHESVGLTAGIQERNPLAGRGGLGWAQWTGPRRVAFEKYAGDRGLATSDPEANYGFLAQELRGPQSKALDAVSRAGSVEEATRAFFPFESGGDPRTIAAMGSRLKFAGIAAGTDVPASRGAQPGAARDAALSDAASAPGAGPPVDPVPGAMAEQVARSMEGTQAAPTAAPSDPLSAIIAASEAGKPPTGKEANDALNSRPKFQGDTVAEYADYVRGEQTASIQADRARYLAMQRGDFPADMAGKKDTVFGPATKREISDRLKQLDGLEADVGNTKANVLEMGFQAAMERRAQADAPLPMAPAAADEIPPLPPALARRDTAQASRATLADSDALTLTPDALAARNQLRTGAQAMMRFAGLPPDAGLKLVDRLLGGGADGSYSRGLVTLALDTAPDRLPGKMFHETVHALMDPALGAITDGQRASLLAGADRYLDKNPQVRAHLTDLYGTDRATLREEAVARMGEDAFRAGLMRQTPGAVVYGKLLNAVRGLGNMLRGQGYRTADDVFHAVLRGDKAAPGSREALAASGPRDPVRAAAAAYGAPLPADVRQDGANENAAGAGRPTEPGADTLKAGAPPVEAAAPSDPTAAGIARLGAVPDRYFSRRAAGDLGTGDAAGKQDVSLAASGTLARRGSDAAPLKNRVDRGDAHAHSPGDFRNPDTATGQGNRRGDVPTEFDRFNLTNDASLLKGSVEARSLDAKRISDFNLGVSGLEHGFSKLKAPARAAMLTSVFNVAHDPQVLNAIVKGLPVDVVNMLRARQLTPEMLFHDRSVLGDVLSLDRNKAIALSRGVADRAMSVIARDAAEALRGPGDLGSGSKEQGAALSARDMDHASSITYRDTDGSRDAKSYSLRQNLAVALHDASEQPRAALSKMLNAALFPMRQGSDRAQVAAFKFANAIRGIQYRYSVIDRSLLKQFSGDERAAMGRALDAQSVSEQQIRELAPQDQASARAAFEAGKAGLAGLSDKQRATVSTLNELAQQTWQRLADRKLVMPNAQGLPFYFPRAFVLMEGLTGARRITPEDNQIVAAGGKREGGTGGGGMTAMDPKGGNLTDRGPMERKHLTAEESSAAARAKFGDGAALVTDIRSLVDALSRQERAVAGRDLIDAIKRIGEAGGTDLVREGVQPGRGYFTLDHPSLWTVGPTGADGPDGKPLYGRTPLHIAEEFRGPLDAVLSQPAPDWYKAIQMVKSKGMGAIMFSPFMHLMVEVGRSLPLYHGNAVALGRAVYRGSRMRGDADAMDAAVKDGVAPIGAGWGKFDPVTVANDVMEAGGGSWLRKLATGDHAVGRAWHAMHQTLLWDQVGNLQMGIYGDMRAKYVAAGFAPGAAGIMAGHLANRYAGALPPEHLSRLANMGANLTMFSRSFTLGNLGVMKDMLNGAPSHIRAAILDAAGEEQATKAQGALRRKAIGAFALDIGLFYGLNAVAQAGFGIARNAGSMGLPAAAQKEWDDYVAGMGQGVLPQSRNEPGKTDRIFVGQDAGGRGTYMRSPIGKVGEEFMGWLPILGHPGQMMLNKASPLLRAAWEAVQGKDSLNRPIYNPHPEGILEQMGVARDIGLHFAKSLVPADFIKQGYDMATGAPVGDRTVAAARLLGPLTGLASISQGNAQGPEAGVEQAAAARATYAKQLAVPEARKLVAAGRVDEARALLERALGNPRDAQAALKPMLNPARGQVRLNTQFLRRADDAGKARAAGVTGGRGGALGIAPP